MNAGQASSFSIIWHWFGLDPDSLSPLQRTLLRCALAVGLFVLVWSFFDMRTYAGVDFRNRIVGARLMLAGKDPYAFFWQPGMPEEWLDPVYDAKCHRLTLSPPGLLPYALIAPLPYRLARLVSFSAEWLAMIVSLALLTRAISPPSPQARYSEPAGSAAPLTPQVRSTSPAGLGAPLTTVFLLGATFFVIASDFWRMHLERGQVYVFYLLALSLAIYFSRTGQVDSLAAGVALGFLGLMRPNMLMMAPALLLARQWRMCGAMLATVAVGAAVTFMVLPLSSWQSYLKVGDQYYMSLQDPDSMPDLPRGKHDFWAEGIDFERGLPHIESSSFAQLWHNLHDNLGVPMIQLALASKIILVGIAASLLALLAWRRHVDRRTVFCLIIVLSLDSEFFLPHRWAYADVMLLAPLALLLPDMLRPERMRLQVLSMVLIGLVSGCVGQRFFEEQPRPGSHDMSLYLATVLRSWVVMGAVTILAVANWLQGQNEPTKAA